MRLWVVPHFVILENLFRNHSYWSIFSKNLVWLGSVYKCDETHTTLLGGDISSIYEFMRSLDPPDIQNFVQISMTKNDRNCLKLKKTFFCFGGRPVGTKSKLIPKIKKGELP